MALGYKQMAEILSMQLTDKEFVRLGELLNEDAESQLNDEIDAILMQTHPELFADEDEK